MQSYIPNFRKLPLKNIEVELEERMLAIPRAAVVAHRRN